MTFTLWTTADTKTRQRALARPQAGEARDLAKVIEIIFNEVRSRGDIALRDYTAQFDGVYLDDIAFDVKKAKAPSLSDGDVAAISLASSNIAQFHQVQFPESLSVETMPGVVCQKVWRPIKTVGLYIPGGSAPLLSTLLMLAIPAKIAGVENIIVCTPPQKGGALMNPYILSTLKSLNIDCVHLVGGAQAIAAMTYGTQTIPKVDKIFGPGNIYVTEAKKYATSLTMGPAIDMPAGPSEVMVVTDDQADPRIIAADLLAQAEHDPLAHVVLVACSTEQIDAVKVEVAEQLASLPREAIAKAAMEQASYIVASDTAEVLEIVNSYAPEHLILNMEATDTLLPLIDNAGSIFIGRYSPESVGDYASGTNHVLPTAGYARNFSGIGTASFMKSITIQELSLDGLKGIAPTVETLANIEGLSAHARSVSLRLDIKREQP